MEESRRNGRKGEEIYRRQRSAAGGKSFTRANSEAGGFLAWTREERSRRNLKGEKSMALGKRLFGERGAESLANIPSRRVRDVCLASWILAHLEPPH